MLYLEATYIAFSVQLLSFKRLLTRQINKVIDYSNSIKILSLTCEDGFAKADK